MLRETPGRVLLVTGLLIAILLVFFAVRVLLVPFVAALFVVYLFDPAVTALQRRGFERGPAFLILLAVTLIGIAGILAVLPAWLQLESIGASNQGFAERFTTQVDALERWANAKFPMFRSFQIAAPGDPAAR